MARFSAPPPSVLRGLHPSGGRKGFDRNVEGQWKRAEDPGGLVNNRESLNAKNITRVDFSFNSEVALAA